MIKINVKQYFELSGIAPKDTAIVLHTKIGKYENLLPRIAVEDVSLFNTFQSVHNAKAGKTLMSRQYLHSFVKIAANRLVFVGMYKIVDFVERGPGFFENSFEYQRLEKIEKISNSDLSRITNGKKLVFNLVLDVRMSELIGRIEVDIHLNQTYVRVAENFPPKCIIVHDNNVLSNISGKDIEKP